jgi:hypothetical protein
VWVCVGTLPHSTTPVAFISTRDQSEGEISCKFVDPRELGQGIRWGIKLSRYLELLLP